MDSSLNFSEMLERIPCPAFAVKNGVVIHTNRAAQQRQIAQGAALSDYLDTEIEEYKNFTNGELCLTLTVCGLDCNATVVAQDDLRIFYLDAEYQEPELRAFALAAQYLKEPLSGAMTCANFLLPDSEDAEMQKQIAQLNKNLFQLHRALCNMTDAAQYQNSRPTRMEFRDVVSIFNEVMEKAAQHIKAGNATLTYCAPNKSVSATIDTEKIERALLNMVSNAVKFSAKGSNIHATLRVVGKKLYFSVENTSAKAPIKQTASVFAHYLRQPGIEDPACGIGLGMSIVRKAASAHGGTLLLEQLENAGVRFTMTAVIDKPKDTRLRSEIRLPVDYAGNYDHTLTELSDILPWELYK